MDWSGGEKRSVSRPPEGRWWRGLSLLVLLVLLLAPPVSTPAAAQNSLTALLTVERDATTEAVISGIQEVFDEAPHPPRVEVRSVDAPYWVGDSPDLWVPLGLRSTLSLGNTHVEGAVLFSLIPHAALTQVLADYRQRHPPASGIHLDQPPRRLLRLAALALPGHQRIGVIAPRGSPTLLDELRDEARRLGKSLVVEPLSDPADLIATLERLLDRSDVLLALPDPMVYNRYTIQKVLLTTYRRGIPVVAFSSALVRAGAAMAVFTSPRQMGRQIGRTIVRFLEPPRAPLPKPSGPVDFSVAINAQVARSLDLRLPDEVTLARRLREAGGDE